MIQRIQSLYLFIALVLNVICLCYPIGFFSVGGHEIGRMYNLWVVSNNIHYFTGWALFAILLAVQPIIVICIALYKKRMVQSRLCVLSSLLIVGYYICYLIFAIIFKNALKADFNISFLVALPLVSLILNLLARHNIIKDEKLVKAADRLR